MNACSQKIVLPLLILLLLVQKIKFGMIVQRCVLSLVRNLSRRAPVLPFVGRAASANPGKYGTNKPENALNLKNVQHLLLQILLSPFLLCLLPLSVLLIKCGLIAP